MSTGSAQPPKQTDDRKNPGPTPETFSLHPLSFEEAVDRALKPVKPKRKAKKAKRKR